MLLRQIANPFYLTGRIWLAAWERSHPDHPWMSPGAIGFLEGFLRKSDVGLEFGSGRSTAWFARQTRHLTSVEHNAQWAEEVRKKIRETGLGNVDYHHVALDHPEEEPHRDFYDPLPRYVDIANRYPDRTFDYVIVDGHYRIACIEATVPKLKAGGILILDNSDWLPMEQWHIPDTYRLVHQSRSVKSQTSLFVKTEPSRE
jgi:predicted O-methyltransferase YrrM